MPYPLILSLSVSDGLRRPDYVFGLRNVCLGDMNSWLLASQRETNDQNDSPRAYTIALAVLHVE